MSSISEILSKARVSYCSVTGFGRDRPLRLFYDTLVFDTPTLRHLVAASAARQMMLGTDYPFNFHDRTPVERIEAAGFDAETPPRSSTATPSASSASRKSVGMSSPWIEGLRSVALDVPDLAQAETSTPQVWHWRSPRASDDALYLRGTGGDHHLLALHRRRLPQIRHVTLRARSSRRWNRGRAAARAGGGRIVSPIAPLTMTRQAAPVSASRPARPSHSRSCTVTCAPRRGADSANDRVRLTHVVLNSHAVDETQAVHGAGARLHAGGPHRDHGLHELQPRPPHASRSAIADNDALNHIAFLMPDADSVMRGGGRMKDAGFPIQWGPGRHGPGNNLFNYFIDPFGVVIEYTAEVEQVDESYRAARPRRLEVAARPGRPVGHLARPPAPRLKEAQRRVLFVPR